MERHPSFPAIASVSVPATIEVPTIQLIRWGAVFGGTAIALALLASLAALWFALAYGSTVDVIRHNLGWYVGLSAIGCILVGGMLAAWLSGIRGWGRGMVHGIAVWALVLLATLAIGVPSVFNVFDLGKVTTQIQNGAGSAAGVSGTLWTSFWSMVGAFVAAMLGGVIGGMSGRDPLVVAEATIRSEDDHDDVTVVRGDRTASVL